MGLRIKTIDHALMKCELSRACWFGTHFSLQTNNLNFVELIDWWKEFCGQDHPITPLRSDYSRMCVVAMWWSLWKAKNEFIFKENKLTL